MDIKKEPHNKPHQGGQDHPDQNPNHQHPPKPNNSKKPSKKPMMPQPSIWTQIFYVLVVFILVSTLYSYLTEKKVDEKQFSLSDLAGEIKAGKVEQITVKGDDLEVKLSASSSFINNEAPEEEKFAKELRKEPGVGLSETLVNYGVTSAELSTTNISVESPSGFGYWVSIIGPFLVPLLFIAILIWYLSRSMKGGGGMQAFTFGQSRAKIIDPKDPKNRITFKDVAGVKEAKQELLEIVDFLKNPKKFLDIGAQIPKGVLMTGSPGTGKTLLARATAGEAGVPFFSISGSEFVEMFVGVGASRVRDLFKLAKSAAPAIIFIDEIDAVGRTRGSGTGGGNDEREQTLNQILVEMDGFEPTAKVIIMAATNRPDVLDPAILRPGRFDRRVTIDPPDREDREQIMQIHAKGKPLAKDVDLTLLATRTPGFSGADLYSLMNEAAILAAREDRKEVTQDDLIRSIEKVMLGPARQSHLLSPREKEITAYHEAGHALVASALPNADPVHKISIVSRGRAGGYTLKLPTEDRKMQSRKVFIDDLAMTLGGYVTELMIFDDITTGPSNDLQVATNLARAMVTRYGMSEKFGPIALEGEGGRALFGYGVHGDEYSEKVGAEIDIEVSKLLKEAEETARKVLSENRGLLEIVAKRLIEVENLEREEYEQLLKDNGFEIKSR